MTLKSDRWIANTSHIAHFNMSVHAEVAHYRIASIPLQKVLELAQELNLPNLTLNFIASAHLGRALSRKDHPDLEPLFEYLEKSNKSAYRAEQLMFNGPNCTVAPMIYPFSDESKSDHIYIDKDGSKKIGKVPSYGLSSYGYDISLGNKFRVLENRHTPHKRNMLDFLTKEVDEGHDHLYRSITADCLELLPGSFMLGVSREWVNIPRDTLGICMQKSSVARMGCVAYVTPLEPGWFGHITLEISNNTEVPMRVYAGMGIMQLLFLQSDEACAVSYADRAGKYQGQLDVPVLSKG